MPELEKYGTSGAPSGKSSSFGGAGEFRDGIPNAFEQKENRRCFTRILDGRTIL